MTSIALLAVLGVALALATLRVRSRRLLFSTTLALCLLAIETGFLLLPLLFPPPGRYVWQHPIGTSDDDLGYRLLPDVRNEVSFSYRGETIYERVPVTTDAKARRSVPPAPGTPERHGLFFGGSFTFGDGVRDEETLPAQVQLWMPGTRAYNFGMGGWGPGQMLVLLGRDESFADVTPRRGFAVYSFIQPHVFRTAGDYPNVTGNEGYPVFALEGDGSLRGPFRWEDDARLRSWIECYRLLTQLSPTARYLIHNRHLQPVLEREAVRVTARVVIEARRRYRERFEGEFYALLWPRWRLQPELEDDFVHRLERAGVPVLRVAAMADDAEATHHPSDPHPTAAEYRWVARQIAEEIAAALERDRSPSSRTSSRMSSTADSPPPPGAGV